MKNEKWIDKLVATPGKIHKVSEFETNFTAGLDKKDSQKLLEENIKKLSKIQDKFYAYDKYSLLVVFQAMDAAGKDGTIKHVMSGINPQGCQVFSFKQPSKIELDHDYMWRIESSMPERGRIGIFNRSHYEEVLITKIHPEILLNEQLPDIKSVDDVTDSFWQKRYRQINDFERHWVENGTIVLKFFLNVSSDEQKKRFLERLNDANKNWKFTFSDIKERVHWDKYMEAFSDMLSYTSTEYAPWYVIPADNKWFMRLAVGTIIIDTLKKLKVNYPKITPEEKEMIAKVKTTLLEEKKLSSH